MMNRNYQNKAAGPVSSLLASSGGQAPRQRQQMSFGQSPGFGSMAQTRPQAPMQSPLQQMTRQQAPAAASPQPGAQSPVMQAIMRMLQQRTMAPQTGAAPYGQRQDLRGMLMQLLGQR